MSKTQQRSETETKPKPRQIKRLRQREAMQHYQPPEYPVPDVPPWKPMG